MLNGEQIQANLRGFVAKWEPYTGTERSEAQTFLNELFACFGSDRSTCGAVFEDSKPADGIMDLYWEGLCIIEMKAPGEKSRLTAHRKQALDYWASSADRSAHRDQPPYVVLCSFNRFEVFEPGRNMREPLAVFDLVDLPDHFEALNFLAGRGVMPLFGELYRDLTTEAAKAVADLYHSVRDRDGAPPEEVQRFVLQLAWCLFAEDLGMLSGHPVQRFIEKLIGDPNTSSYAELGALFDVLNDPGDYGRKGILAGTTYVNGTLFEKAARVHLEPAELRRRRTRGQRSGHRVGRANSAWSRWTEGRIHRRGWAPAAHRRLRAGGTRASTASPGDVQAIECGAVHKRRPTCEIGGRLPAARRPGAGNAVRIIGAEA